MFGLKLRIQQHLIRRKIKKNQEVVSTQVKDSNPVSVLFSGFLKLLVLCFFGIVILFPFFFMISISLMTDDEVRNLSTNFRVISDFREGSTHIVGKEGNGEILEWSAVVANTYKRAFSTGYWSSLGYTSLNVVLSVLLKVFITFLMGYAFSLAKWRGKNVVWFIALALLVLPEVALLSGQYIVVYRTNLRANYTSLLFAIVLPFVSSIFNTVMYKNAFEAIPGRIKEVSLIDGANGLKYMFKIAFPMVMPTTLTIIILTALASWNAYLWPSILVTDSNQLNLLSVWLFKAGIDNSDTQAETLQNIKMAAALIVILPMFIIYLLLRKRIMGAISRQGSTIKG
ncbi:multiple sugar transport system permease protein [Mycoplasmopsis mustelae]|uniref:Multiple sugar transport system permease protein n=1 Tax=Mycoplasmopsis mustelae TaxID=171289 RepID=A0A4R7UEU9_9BACT|nr:carbohydrate ABC transporter permease [Mycoplasmopsis mustelae]TDV24155.1 multiple sugar transport system permease protein [Mycoplasmopsis mustelae]